MKAGLLILLYALFPIPAEAFWSFFSSKKSTTENSLIVALGSEPRTLDPRRATDANGMRIAELLFQSLVRLGPNGKIQPSACQKWTYKNKTYTFWINKSLTFSNKRPLAKEDILFSFEEYRSAKNPFSSSFQIIESVRVNETAKQFILKLKLKKESAKFLAVDLSVLKLLPKKEALFARADFRKNPIGTGPFQLISADSSQLVLKARSDTKPAPKIDKLIFKIIRDDFTRFQKMMNKEIDIAQSEISFQKIGRFINQADRFKVFRKPGASVTYLLMNLKDPCLKNKTLRRALSLSIDRQKIIHHKLKGFARPAVTLLGPNHFFFKPNLKNPVYNLSEAKRLLSQLSPACQRKSLVLKTSQARFARDHGQILALQLKKAGLNIRSQSFDWGIFYEDLKKGRFQLALLKWVGVIDPDIYRLAFHSDEQPPKGRNRSFYANKTLDLLLEQGILTMEIEKRKAIYHKIQKMIQNELVFIPLWHEEQIAVVRKNIVNYHLSNNGDFYYLTQVLKTSETPQPKRRGTSNE